MMRIVRSPKSQDSQQAKSQIAMLTLLCHAKNTKSHTKPYIPVHLTFSVLRLEAEYSVMSYKSKA